ALASRLQMVNLGGSSGGSGDRDRLVKGLHQPVALAAHMRAVDAAATRGLPREGRQLSGFGVLIRAIDQRRCHPECALLHRLSDKMLHRAKLRCRRLLVALSEHEGAHGPSAYE